MASPVSPTHSKVPSIAAFTRPFAPGLLLRSPLDPRLLVPSPLRPAFPVAYSLPMLGKTFSPALSETKRAKGVSQTQMPKNEAISVNVGISAIGQFDDWEMSEIPSIYCMAADAEQGKSDGEAINNGEEELNRHDSVDGSGQQLLGKYRVLFYQFREVVEARGCGASMGIDPKNRDVTKLPMASVRKPKPNKTPA
ncbi:MAG: hypothetical protein Q9186_003610 [Xanthomendoza sp. 1 TL-2023]